MQWGLEQTLDALRGCNLPRRATALIQAACSRCPPDIASDRTCAVNIPFPFSQTTDLTISYHFLSTVLRYPRCDVLTCHEASLAMTGRGTAAFRGRNNMFPHY